MKENKFTRYTAESYEEHIKRACHDEEATITEEQFNLLEEIQKTEKKTKFAEICRSLFEDLEQISMISTPDKTETLAFLTNLNKYGLTDQLEYAIKPPDRSVISDTENPKSREAERNEKMIEIVKEMNEKENN